MFNERVWKEGESLAQSYMKNQGYKIKYTNFAAVGAELDIVAVLPKKVQQKNLKKELKQNLKLKNNKTLKCLEKTKYINLIKNANDLLIITEVKSRSSIKFGEGMEAVNFAKQKNILRATEVLMQKSEFKGLQIRFDVASIDGGVVNYIEDAFKIN